MSGRAPQAPTGGVLVGFMGSGKSSVGAAVAGRLGVPFVDTDALIEHRHGTIAAIFERQGEAAFRAIERDVVLGCLAGLRHTPAVVCLGGGAVTDADVRAALRAARVVWLSAPPEVLWARVAPGPASPAVRPLASDERAFRELFARRETLYREVATATVDATALFADVVDQVVTALTTT